MGKLLSYIVGTGLILFLSYYYLSIFFYPLIMWLSPAFGAPVMLITGNLLFLLGNMVHHTYLIPLYIVVGACIGLSSRKGRRALTATMGIYSTILSITGISLFFILETNPSIIGAFSSLSSSQSTGASGLISTMPPLPSGITLSSITSEPLLQRLISIMGTLSSNLSSVSTSSLFSDFSTMFPVVLHSFIIFAVEDFLVVIVSAILVGYLVGKVIRRIPLKIGNKASAPAGISSKNVVIIMILLLVISMGFMSVPMAHSGVQANGKSMVDGQSTVMSCIASGKSMIADGSAGNLSLISGFVGKTGDSFTVLGSLENGTHARNLIPGLNHSMMSVVEISLNFSNLMNQLYTNSIYSEFNLHYSILKNYYDAVSGGILISLVLENTSASALSYGTADTAFIEGLGGADVTPLLSTVFPGNYLGINANTYVGVYVYAFTLNLSHISGNVRNGTLMSGNSQERSVLLANLQSHLGTGKPQNLSSFVYAAGCINSSSLGKLTEETPLSNAAFSSGESITFSLSIFEQNSVYHSSGEHHSFTMAHMIGYSSNLSDLNGSNTVMITGIPVSQSGSGYNVTVYYQNSSLLKHINFGYATHNTIYGNTLDPMTEVYTSNMTFPAYLTWSEHTGVVGSHTHYISVTVTNKDNSTLYNVTLNASAISDLYPHNSLRVIGTSSINSSSLATGEDLKLNFTVLTENPGAYVFPPPELSYESNGTLIVSSGYTLNIVQGNQSLYSTVNDVIHFYVGYAASNVYYAISYLNITIFPEFYLFDLLISLIIIGDIILEVRMFARWRKNRDKK